MTDTRRVSCSNCGHIWHVAASRPESPLYCPQCAIHVCACGCGEDLSDMRADSIYFSRAHAVALKRAGGHTPRAASANAARTDPLADVRAAQEAARAEWSTAIYAEIVRILQGRGSFHADDLDPMDVPDDCRNIIGAQIGSLVSRGWAKEVGRRASSNPARHRRKSGVYELTRKGREGLAQVASDNREGTAGKAHQGLGTLDRPAAMSTADSSGARSSGAGHLGELKLVPDEVGPEPPRSAITDSRAA